MWNSAGKSSVSFSEMIPASFFMVFLKQGLADLELTAQTGLQPAEILLSQPPEYWDGTCTLTEEFILALSL